MGEQDIAEVELLLDGVTHKGLLCVPEFASGIVLFAHGSGSSRLSRRNNYVAEIIRQRGIATLLFDLLTEEEDFDYENRFDIPLLTNRLIEAAKWVKAQSEYAQLKTGFFGASTGAAAALQAAADMGSSISAVVSRGGRPDLAGDTALAKVTAPTLLIVGGYDNVVIELNQQAYARMKTTKDLQIVPGATHLFEEPGTLEQVAALATEWFARYLMLNPED